MKHCVLVIVTLLLCCSVSVAQQAEPADLILINGCARTKRPASLCGQGYTPRRSGADRP